MKELGIRLRRDESGATVTDCGLIAALISVVLIGTLATVAPGEGARFGEGSEQAQLKVH